MAVQGSRPASERQLAFIRTLADERDTDSAAGSNHWDHMFDVLGGKFISSTEASGTIKWLLSQPRKQAAPRQPRDTSATGERVVCQNTMSARKGTLAECGLYRHDGRLFVVREFQPRDEYQRDHSVRTGRVTTPAKVRFARELVANEHSEADQANGNGAAVKLHAVKAPGMQYQLTPAEAVSLEEVAALGIQFGECLICGTPIETKASVVDRGGIGPVCHGKQAALLARKGG